MFRGLDRIVLVMAVAMAPTARALAQDDVTARLDQARELVLYARYGEASRAIEGLLAQEGLDAAQRNAALELLATSQVAQRDRRATQTLSLLYSRDPGHRLSDPDASPTVLSAFARARESATDRVQVVLEHDPPTLSRRSAPVIEVHAVEGADAVQEMRLRYRQGDAGGFTAVVMGADGAGGFSARLPLDDSIDGEYDVQYHVEALAPSLTPLSTLGSGAEPMTITVPAPSRADVMVGTSEVGVDDGEEPSGSIFGAWWFWTSVAVVVGGGVAAWFLFGPPSQDDLPDTTLGTVPVR